MAVKNLIICCDGTWQELSQRCPTNVTRLTRALAPTATRGGQTIPQVIFYDDGVGVGTGVLDKTTRILGGALGHGLDRKVLEAYEFLVLNYQPGDRIYIFGFSRGAYTARSVAGLLRQVWILKRENASEIEREGDSPLTGVSGADGRGPKVESDHLQRLKGFFFRRRS